jgi:hypothetical protein
MKDPLKDKQGRRRSSAPVQPSDKPKPGGYTLNDRDLRLLQFLHLAGGRLTTPILFRFAKREGLYRNIKSLQKRLKEWRQELRLTDWPPEQFLTIEPWANPLVHQITLEGKKVLQDAGLYFDKAPSPRGFYKHQLMVACAYACYWLDALDNDLPFVPQHLLTFNKITVNNKRVIPDAMFMICLQDKKPRLIFFEADRDTEAGYSEDEEAQSWTRKIKAYKSLISDGLYRQFVEVPDECRAQLHVLTVSHLMKDRILKEVARAYQKDCKYIFVHATPSFGIVFRPPKNIEVLSAVWERHNASAFRFVTPQQEPVHSEIAPI